jgi:hypothetical protein
MTATYRNARDDFNGINKGDVVTIHTDKGTVTGEFVSVNSKGANIKVDGKVISRSLNAITDVTTPATPNVPADMFTDGTAYTTAELAAMFSTTARELRVQLRTFGMGVGKGHRYGFSADEARAVAKLYTTEA